MRYNRTAIDFPPAGFQKDISMPVTAPTEPTSIAETGLNLGFIADMIMKMLYQAGTLNGYQLSSEICLPYPNVIDGALEFLKKEQLVAMSGTGGLGRIGFEYTLSERGVSWARNAMERDQYIGPAPVPFDNYVKAVGSQSVRGVRVNPAEVMEAMSHLVLNPAILDLIGPAVNSTRSLFLYGPPGNGKTTIAQAIANIIHRDSVFIPYSLIVDGHIIKLFDEFDHHIVEESEWVRQGRDNRWRHIHRPFVVAGGELNMADLDLIYDPTIKYYEAPPQIKANNGVFLIDDFGRQQMRPQDLLNRWIVPLETQVDFLTLHTGKKIEVPFDAMIIFSTNLDPKELVDEAFLRRIRHKLLVADPTPEEFHEILKRVCQGKGVTLPPGAFDYLMDWYRREGRNLRSVHPRDLVDHVVDIANYRDYPPVFSPEAIEQACGAYFTEL